MVFEFPKSFGHYLLVREKEFLSNGKPGGWFSGLKTERIAMESEEFNEKRSMLRMNMKRFTC